MVNKENYSTKLIPLVAGFLSVDGWCLQCNWINGPSGPPKILRGGKYMTRVGGGVRSRLELATLVGKYKTRMGFLKLALALIGSGGKILIDWSRKNRMAGNGIQLRQ